MGGFVTVSWRIRNCFHVFMTHHDSMCDISYAIISRSDFHVAFGYLQLGTYHGYIMLHVNHESPSRGCNGSIPKAGTETEPLELFVANAGTAARFLSVSWYCRWYL